MQKRILVLLAAAIFASACATLGQAQQDLASPTARPIVRSTSVPPTASPTTEPTPTQTTQPTNTPEPTATAVLEPPAKPTTEPTPTRISEVLPAASEPEPITVRGGTNPALPPDTGVSWTGCASDGECLWYNFYWAPTREIVLQPGEGQNKVWHEYGHAHQHWSINGGEPLRPSDYDLESWYQTAEGISYVAAVSGLPWPWTHSAQSGLEDFAWTFGYWYSDPAYLLSVSPERYDWAAANLP